MGPTSFPAAALVTWWVMELVDIRSVGELFLPSLGFFSTFQRSMFNGSGNH